MEHLLLYLISIPLIGMLGLIITPAQNELRLKLIALQSSCLTFLISLLFIFRTTTQFF